MNIGTAVTIIGLIGIMIVTGMAGKNSWAGSTKLSIGLLIISLMCGLTAIVMFLKMG
jgi:hypothetical protein